MNFIYENLVETLRATSYNEKRATPYNEKRATPYNEKRAMSHNENDAVYPDEKHSRLYMKRRCAQRLYKIIPLLLIHF